MLSSPSAEPEAASRPSLAGRVAGGFGASILAGALLGGSAWFSDQLAWPYSLFVPTNAIGVWVGVAFVLGASAGTLPTGALRGLVGLLTAVGAYYLLFAALGAGYRAIGAGHAATVWGLVALVAGPVMGGAGATWRHGHGWPRAFAVAILSSALLAEGVMFGLGRLAHVDQLASDPGAVLFGIEIVIGVALPGLLLAAGERLRGYGLTVALGAAGALAIGPVTATLRGIADSF